MAKFANGVLGSFEATRLATGHALGYEHTFIHAFVELMAVFREDRQPVPNFEDGVKCQQVLEAVDLSIEQKRWIKVADI